GCGDWRWAGGLGGCGARACPGREFRDGGSSRPVIPRARRERHRQLDVLFEHVALGDEGAAGLADALEIVVARPVALLDGCARIAGGFALAAGARARGGLPP